MSLSLHTRRARLLALRDTLDASGNAVAWLMDGTKPENPDTAATTTPVAIVTLQSPSASLGTGAVLTITAALGNATRNGTPTWVRLMDGAGNAVLDATAGAPGSGAAFIVTNGDTPPSAQLYAGGEVTISATITEP